MKLVTIDTIAGILGAMKLHRIQDKEVKSVLVEDHINFKMCLKEVKERSEAYRAKFREDWADEMTAVEILRRKKLPVEGHEEYLKAARDANQALQDMFEVEVEVEFRPVSLSSFLESCGGEDLTLDQVAFLQEHGIIEKQ